MTGPTVVGGLMGPKAEEFSQDRRISSSWRLQSLQSPTARRGGGLMVR